MKTAKRTRWAARRLFRACLVGGRLDEGRVRQAVSRVAASRRRGSLPLLTHMQRLVRLEYARHQALVESATPLSSELRSSVETNLTRAYGPGVNLAFSENPALIGGMRVKVGS